MNSQSTNSTVSESPLLPALVREPSETLAAAEGSVPQDDPASATATLSTAEQPLSVPDLLGEILVEIGVINAEQLRRARRIQDRLPNTTTLLAVLEELRLTTRDQVRETLKSRRRRIPIPLGAFLFELGYVREIELRLAV